MALHTVIMAGGKGERLWPLSTPDHPKQLIAFSGDKSLLRDTFERSLAFSKPETIYVVTGELLRGEVLRQIPEIPEENILAEPFGRNTAPCIGYAGVVISQRDPEGIMIVFPSDHTIEDVDGFSEVIATGVRALETYPELLITIGLVPDSPETGYGYIAPGETLFESGKILVHQVTRFHEKPTREKALEYIHKGFLWNGGMFLWKAATILKMFARHMPEMHRDLMSLEDSLRRSCPGALREFYERAPSLSIDYGVMEKAEEIAVIPAQFGWSDIGSWDALGRYLECDEDGNGARGGHCFVDSRGNVTSSFGKKVVLVDVNDLVVVEGKDTILVCPRKSSQRVSDIARKIQN
ncbi:MAG: mannose-1-phosphate guanylyltransferase [Desulfomonilia bacterium]|nr:mannose-1-phosphate guanylyltransferase [Desulfomonilia bacterium]